VEILKNRTAPWRWRKDLSVHSANVVALEFEIGIP
jgi:hypothetical protein